MPAGDTRSVGPVVPTAGAISALRPLAGDGVTVRGGFWGDRLRLNRERTLRHGHEQLTRAGTFENFRLAAGAKGEYRALGVMFSQPFPFLDSDVYKWLEAMGWELGRGPDPELATMADEAIALVAGAQRPDGYLNTFVQVVGGGRPYEDLAWGHELYTLGHLVQAAIAWQRALGDGRLLAIAERAVEHVHAAIGPGRLDMIDGHPEIEMALVELYRTTGDGRHLDLADWMLGRRGQGLLGEGRFGSAYWQDHQPVAEARTVAGHAVRQLYLDCGAVDVAVERGDTALLGAVQRRWRDMVERHSYLTGGVGSRHKDEAFGDPFELPPDRAYTETCAAIASVMLAWRMLLATGDPLAADVIERTLYNAVLPGLALDGTAYFYINPLQRRTQRAPAGPREGARQTWYACACCPPNLMRTLSSFEALAATSDGSGVQLQQYATADLRTTIAGGMLALEIETAAPWSSDVRVRVVAAPDRPIGLGLRIPDWSTGASIEGPDGPVAIDGRLASVTRAWRTGDEVRLRLPTDARVTRPHPRIDAVRGCLAIERGPLVYAIESADLPAGLELEQVSISPDVQPRDAARPDLGPGVVGLDLPVRGPAGGADQVAAIPYFTWANRTVDAMRVWIPVTDDAPGGPPSRSTG